MPDINYQSELTISLLAQMQLERDMRLMRESYSKLMAENQYLREQSKNHSAIIRGKNESLETIIRERDALKASESNFRNMLRSMGNHPRLIQQYREAMKLIHDLSRPIAYEQVSEASGESNLVAQGIPAGGEIRHDREAKAACDSKDADAACESAVRQGSALDSFICKICGDNIRRR